MVKKLRLILIFSLLALTFGLTAITWSAQSKPQVSEARVHLASFASGSSFSLHPGELVASYVSPELTPVLEHPFDVVGLQWEGDFPEGSTVSFWLSDQTGLWIEAPLVEHESKDNNTAVNDFITQPVLLTGTSTHFKIQIERPSLELASPVVRNVQLIAVNAGETSPVLRAFTSARKTQADSGPTVISRAEWGADEAYRFTSDNEELWTPTYKTPKKFIVHHTAGSTGGTDPSATIRAIYYWHAQVLGWGDIGYNYLIDPSGTIYEGRYGGDGVVGAHAYNDVSNVNYNEGSIGIVLLGCYEADDDGACSSIAEPTSEILAAVSQLIGTKGKQFKIKPVHSPTAFKDVSIRNVVGHRDVDYTLCPGSIVHDDLKLIRQMSQTVYDSLNPAYRAKLELSDLPSSMTADTRFSLTTTWKNTGTETWEQQEVFLKVYNGSGHAPTPLHTSVWSDTFGKFYPEETSIAPGEVATFIVPLKTLDETTTRKLQLKLFKGKERISIPTAVHSLNVVQPVFFTHLQVDHPVAVLKGWRPTVSVSATNSGTQTLPAGAKLLLNGQIMAKTEGDTAAGEEATWSFVWTPPQTLGNHIMHWKVLSQGKIISGSKLESVVRVDKK